MSEDEQSLVAYYANTSIKSNKDNEEILRENDVDIEMDKSSDNYPLKQIKIEDVTFEFIPTTGYKKCYTAAIHQSKYELPFYCNQNYQKLPLKERVKLFCEYHNKLSKRLSLLASESYNCAKIGPEITASTKAINSIIEDSQEDFGLDDFYENESVYVSRHGRHTKRKSYTESFYEPSSSKSKKKCEDVEWLNKEQKKLQTKPKEMETQEKPQTSKNQRRNVPKKPTNEIIMQKSKLFKDTGNPTRGALMAMKAKVVAKEQQEKENDIEKYVNNLEPDSDEEFESPNTKLSSPKLEQQLNQKRDISDDVPNNTHIEDDSLPKNENIRKKNSNNQTASANVEICLNTVECPICYKRFAEDIVQQHAATCGEDMVVTRSSGSLS